MDTFEDDFGVGHFSDSKNHDLIGISCNGCIQFPLIRKKQPSSYAVVVVQSIVTGNRNGGICFWAIEVLLILVGLQGKEIILELLIRATAEQCTAGMSIF